MWSIFVTINLCDWRSWSVLAYCEIKLTLPHHQIKSLWICWWYERNCAFKNVRSHRLRIRSINSKSYLLLKKCSWLNNLNEWGYYRLLILIKLATLNLACWTCIIVRLYCNCLTRLIVYSWSLIKNESERSWWF